MSLSVCLTRGFGDQGLGSKFEAHDIGVRFHWFGIGVRSAEFGVESLGLGRLRSQDLPRAAVFQELRYFAVSFLLRMAVNKICLSSFQLHLLEVYTRHSLGQSPPSDGYHKGLL